MALFARQCAWLQQRPLIPGKDGKREELSRAESLEKRGLSQSLPVVTARYLQGYLIDVGFSLPGFNGPVSLTALEIQAWANMSCVELEQWEFSALRNASRAFCNQYGDDTPIAPVDDEQKEEAVKAQLKNFKSMFGNK